jgi:hypothetical protein
MLITDLELAISQINYLLATDKNIPTIDIGEGLIRRIEFCRYYKVDKNMLNYLNVLRTLNYPRRQTTIFNNNLVIYFSKTVRTTFYDKFEESKDPESIGLLKHETKITDTEAIASYTGVKKPKLKDITADTANRILDQDISRLKLNETEVFLPGELLIRLIEVFPKSYYKVFGIIFSLVLIGEHEMLKSGLIIQHELARVIKQMSDAGIVPTVLLDNKKLPPLMVEPDLMNSAKCPELVSNTLAIS